MNFKSIIPLTVAAPMLWISPSNAAEINWNGFMSIAAGKTTTSDMTYLVEPTSNGVYDNEIRFDPESVVGLQAQVVISDRLRATVQMVSKGANDFNTTVDWAYLSYALTNDLTMNAGRFRLPLFYYSDFLDVGYAYHWIRPPVEVYNAFTAGLEGVNFYHSKLFGAVQLETQVWYGAIDSESTSEGTVSEYAADPETGMPVLDPMFGFPVLLSSTPANITTRFDVSNNTGITSTLSWNWLRFRLLYNETEIAQSVTTSIPQPTALIVDADLDVSFMAAAFMVDVDNVFLRSEFTRAKRKTTSAPSFFEPMGSVTTIEDDYWYVSGGYNVGDFTPHLTRTKVKADPFGFTSDSTTDTVGLAWNFTPSATFKVEYARVKQTGLDWETFTPVENKFNVVSTAIDLMF